MRAGAVPGGFARTPPPKPSGNAASPPLLRGVGRRATPADFAPHSLWEGGQGGSCDGAVG